MKRGFHRRSLWKWRGNRYVPRRQYLRPAPLFGGVSYRVYWSGVMDWVQDAFRVVPPVEATDGQ